MQEYLKDLKVGGRPMTDKELAEHYKHLYSEVKKQKDDVVELCNKSIKSINDRLAFVDTSKTYPNEYQRIRLKAFRTKCKEILRMLGECNE